MAPISRRDFFKAGGATAAALATQSPATALTPPSAEAQSQPKQQQSKQSGQPARRRAYAFFHADEAVFIEAATDRLIPPDDNGPGAVAAGVPQYLDQQLGGAWGGGERLYRSGPWHEGTPSQGYQLPYTPAELFRHALASIAADLRKQRKTSFDKLPGKEQDAYLESLQKGQVQLDAIPGHVFFESLLGMTIEGYFSDPVYGGNLDMASWKMIGFPGAYASFYELVDQHGKLYQRIPISIGDNGAGKIMPSSMHQHGGGKS
jgi:gluconate 2-dehydrogenase gamma chain